MFSKILIANRGEIVCCVIKTARKMVIKTVAIYSDADRNALHVAMADEAVHIGPPPANHSYIVIDKVMQAIRQVGQKRCTPDMDFFQKTVSSPKLLMQRVSPLSVHPLGPSKKWVTKSL